MISEDDSNPKRKRGTLTCICKQLFSFANASERSSLTRRVIIKVGPRP